MGSSSGSWCLDRCDLVAFGAALQREVRMCSVHERTFANVLEFSWSLGSTTYDEGYFWLKLGFGFRNRQFVEALRLTQIDLIEIQRLDLRLALHCGGKCPL